VEVTPNAIRVRKRYLTEAERKRFGKKVAEPVAVP
jgi:predicted membrane GTPase involved in stress response